MNRPPPIGSFSPVAEPQGAHGAAQQTRGSLVLRIGLIVAGGVITALVSALPAALRMGDDASPLRAVEQWLVLTAIATPLGILAVFAIGRARAGLRILAGDRTVAFAAGFLWWCVIELGLLSLFGALLKKTTHNHALAGAAFAMFGTFTGILVLLFARRASVVLASGGPASTRAGFAIAAACAGLVTLLVLVRTARADDLHTAGGLVDAVLFGTLATLTSSRILARFRALAIVGMPIAVLVVIAGLTTLGLDPSLRDSLTVTAPLHGLVIDFFR